VIEADRADDAALARGLKREEDEHAFGSVNINLDRLKRVADARQWLALHCDSPIEVILGSFLFATMQELAFAPFVPRLCLTVEALIRPATEILLIPQFQWGRYRVDLALRIPTTPPRVLFIECDGREFHSTEQQIARDKGRQQEMVDAGYPVFRLPARKSTSIRGLRGLSFGARICSRLALASHTSLARGRVPQRCGFLTCKVQAHPT
jgi:hypothetical protein